MRRPIIAVALLLSACGGTNAPRQLIILHTNDEHSHMLGFGPETNDFPAPTAAGHGDVKGGAARRAVVLAAERKAAQAAGADVLTVSAGDNAMGTLLQAAFVTEGADYRLMKLLGYDVTCLGNHEFDYGPAALAGAIAAAKASAEGAPVIVSSNIQFNGGGDEPLSALFDRGHADPAKPLHRSWLLTTAGGIKVGLVGVMGANASQVAPLKKPVTFSASGGMPESDFAGVLTVLHAQVQAQVDALRLDGAEVVLALSHSGIDQVTLDSSEDILLAKAVTGIDVIVSGHSHTDFPAQLVTNPKSGKQVLVQQAGRFGDQVGRIRLRLSAGAVTFDAAGSALLPVDDTTVPDTTVAAWVAARIGEMETVKLPAVGQSFIDWELGLTTGRPLPAYTNVGDHAFAPVADGTAVVTHFSGEPRESPLLRLMADADLAAVEAEGLPTDLAIEAQGVLRASLEPSKAGRYSFDDVFRVVPLGASPASGTLGYPLARFGVYLAELKAAFEVAAGLAYTTSDNSDLYLVPSGFCFTYNTSRPMFDPAGSTLDPSNGRVTRIYRATSHAPAALDSCDQLLFDADDPAFGHNDGYAPDQSPLSFYTVTTNLYVATFASVAGVKLKDPSDYTHTYADPAEAIVHRQSPLQAVEIKEWEALGRYLGHLSAPGAGGQLPARYTQATSTRAICSGPLCKK